MKKFLAVILFTSVLSLQININDTHALSCLEADPERYYTEADVIVKGVTTNQSNEDLYPFIVLDAWKTDIKKGISITLSAYEFGDRLLPQREYYLALAKLDDDNYTLPLCIFPIPTYVESDDSHGQRTLQAMETYLEENGTESTIIDEPSELYQNQQKDTPWDAVVIVVVGVGGMVLFEFLRRKLFSTLFNR